MDESWRTTARVPFMALRSGPYKYIRNMNDLEELYDLEADPYELKNRIEDPHLADLREKLSGELNATVQKVRGTLSFKSPGGTISSKYKGARGAVSDSDANYEGDDF